MGPRKREGSKAKQDALKVFGGLTVISPESSNFTEQDSAAESRSSEQVANTTPVHDQIAGAATQVEARKLAQEAVWLNARKLVTDLVNEPGGQYLAIRFLFEFAGLMTAEEQKESKADLKAFMQDLLNRPKTGLPKQTSDARLNLSSSGDTDRCRS